MPTAAARWAGPLLFAIRTGAASISPARPPRLIGRHSMCPAPSHATKGGHKPAFLRAAGDQDLPPVPVDKRACCLGEQFRRISPRGRGGSGVQDTPLSRAQLQRRKDRRGLRVLFVAYLERQSVVRRRRANRLNEAELAFNIVPPRPGDLIFSEPGREQLIRVLAAAARQQWDPCQPANERRWQRALGVQSKDDGRIEVPPAQFLDEGRPVGRRSAVDFIQGAAYSITPSTSGIWRPASAPARDVSKVIWRPGTCSFSARRAGPVMSTSPMLSRRTHSTRRAPSQERDAHSWLATIDTATGVAAGAAGSLRMRWTMEVVERPAR